LRKPIAVAIGEESKQVYVLDEGEAGQFGRVVRFDLAGTKVEGEFDGSGSHGEGAAAGGGGTTGEIPTGQFEEPQGIAVDNTCALRRISEPKLSAAECEALDPSNGDVYVADSGINHRVIDKYTADGKYLGQLNCAGVLGCPNPGEVKFSSEGLEGVAVDPSGGVWVYRERPAVDGFTSANPNAFTKEVELGRIGNPPAGLALPGIAVDAKGDFYGDLGVNFPPRVVKWNEKGNLLDEELGSEETSGVAVDQSNNTAFVDNLTSVGVFNPEGGELERLGEGQLSAGTGLGADASTDSLYAAEASGAVLLFGPASPGVPKIEGESFAAVGSDRASLGAEINPSSEEKPEEGQTEYHFQYGPCKELDPKSCETSGYEKETPVGELSPDFAVHPVSAEVLGLQPNTTYHFRAIAKNKHGEGAPGKEQSFTTEGPGGEVALPDDRGYELVSPPDKQGARLEPITEVGVVQAAASGSALTYQANAPTEADPAGYTNTMQLLSRRGAGAWSTRDLAIAHSGATGLGPGPAEYKFFDGELQLGVVQPFGPFTPELSEEASEASAFLNDLGEGCENHCLKPLVTGKAGIANVPEGTAFGEDGLCLPDPSRLPPTAREVCGPRFIGASEDLSHVLLRSESVALAPGAVPRELFEWVAGKLTPVSVLPGASHTPVEGLLGLENNSTRGAIAREGERIFWESGVTHDLYLRDVQGGQSVQLDQGEGCGGCASGGGRFQFASADGSRVIFSDEQALTEDAGAEAKKPDLYECAIVPSGEGLTCELHDLTPRGEGGEGADVQGGILGAGADGAAVYFVAEGVQSKVANGRGEKAVPGQPNLYVHREDATEFIATLSSESVGGELGDETDWREKLEGQPTRVSPNGRFLELMSQARLTGYDNRDVATGKPSAEVYLYDAVTKELECASCDPSGGRPAGVEYHKLEPGSGGLVGGPRDVWTRRGLVAANVPGWTSIGNAGLASRYQPRYLSNSGRLFFNSVNALVPQDANGTQDVYEYEPPGIRSAEGKELCSTSMATYSPRSGGCVALISSGRSAQESAFLDASESGDDVFFLTSAKLSPLDTDAARDVYDAHVCTDSPCITFPNVGSPPCNNESSCKASPTPQPSIFGAPASATFSGPANPPPPAPPKPKSAEQIRIEKLSHALKACHAKKNKHKRQSCEKAARKRYAKPKAKKSSHRKPSHAKAKAK
jgi:hypothetical protein